MIPIKDDSPTNSFPLVTIALIVINLLVFIYQLPMGANEEFVFVQRAGAIPYEIMHLKDIYPTAIIPIPFTIFTAMFIHGGVMHVTGNMLYLWIFGDNIEDKLGHLRFLLFYLLAGLAAGMIHVITFPHSNIPMIGASGAIAGVLGAYLVSFPRAKVHTVIFFIFFVNIVKIPAVIFLGLWFFLQILGSGSGGGIAWFAHIGGFVTGICLIKIFEMTGKVTRT